MQLLIFFLKTTDQIQAHHDLDKNKEPEYDGKYKGKSWNEIKHCWGKFSRSVINSSIPSQLCQAPTKRLEKH